MKQLNWGDELLGVKITRDDWQRGIIASLELDGSRPWSKVGKHCYQHIDSGLDLPVYPPVGWVDKSEDEIWEAMADYDNGEPIYLTDEIWVWPGGDVTVRAECDEIQFDFDKDELQQFITALQNAQVLSARIREGQRE